MIGIVVAGLLLMFHVEQSMVLLAFIGLELFGVNMQLNYFRMVDKHRRDAMGTFLEGLRKGLTDGREHNNDTDDGK